MVVITAKVCHLKEPISFELLSSELGVLKKHISRYFVGGRPSLDSFEIRCNFDGQSCEVPHDDALNEALKKQNTIFSWYRAYSVLKRNKEAKKNNFHIVPLFGMVEYDSYSGFDSNLLNTVKQRFKDGLEEKDQHSYSLVLSDADGSNEGSLNSAKDILSDRTHLCFVKSIAYSNLTMADMSKRVEGLLRQDGSGYIKSIKELVIDESLNALVDRFLSIVAKDNSVEPMSNTILVSVLAKTGLTVHILNKEIESIMDNCLLMYFHLLQSTYDPEVKVEHDLGGAYSEASRRLITNVLAMVTSKLHGIRCDPDHDTEHEYSDRVGHGPLDYHLRSSGIIKLVDFNRLRVDEDREEEDEESEVDARGKKDRIQEAAHALENTNATYPTLVNDGIPQIVGQMLDLLNELMACQRSVGVKSKIIAEVSCHTKGTLSTGQHNLFFKLQATEEEDKPALVYYGDGVLNVLPRVGDRPHGVDQELDVQGYKSKGVQPVDRNELKRLLLQYYFFYSPFI